MSEHVVLPRPLSRLRQAPAVHSTADECPADSPTPADGTAPAEGTEQVPSLLRRRGVAIGVAVAVVAMGILYFFFYDPLFRHSNTWTDPSDLWGTFRAAHYVGWGYLGGIYSQETGTVTFPGIAVVLAPVAMLSDVFHMSSTIGFFRVAHPTAALLLVPTVLVLASTVVIAADALADELGVGAARRGAIALLVGAMAWATTIFWGHPEDALVMTFGCWAMVAVQRDNWRRAGWLFGIAILFQPLIALTVPLFFAATPRGQRALFAVRCSVLSVFLVGVAFLGNPSGAYRALVKQPTPPYVNHATPWVSLAPHVALSGTGSGSSAAGLAHSASGAFLQFTAPSRELLQVSAGPGRTVYLLLALLAGLYVWRRPQDPVRLLWLAGVVLGARCYFEAVMTPYYLTPPLILLIVMAARRGRWQFGVSFVVAAAISLFAYRHFTPWVWWTPVVVAITVVMALSFPPATSTHEEGDEPARSVEKTERDGSLDLQPVS